MRNRHNQLGYSLAELLVVVAIIGLISLVSVPAFMAYRETAKIKGSLRQLTGELRNARQRAITKNRPVMISLEPTNKATLYRTYDGNSAGTSWTRYGNDRRLDKAIYVSSTTFEDDELGDTLRDIVFRTDGTISPLPTETEAGKEVTKLVMRIDYNRIAFNQYTIYFETTGRLRAVGSKF